MHDQQIQKNKFLITGGILSVAASMLHIAIIIGGANWYRFFGAGEGMVQLAEKGSTYPMIITILIASILMLWALYAFSGAGLIMKLPLLKPILVIISMIYGLRGIIGIPIVVFLDYPYLNELKEKMMFMIFSSIISLIFGYFYFKGSMHIKPIGNKTPEKHKNSVLC